MKIEKLTENKIRVIINSEELGMDTTNVHRFMAKAIETQEIFKDILKKAEKEVNFYTDDCKLLIEAFSSLEDVIIFTITKYKPQHNTKKKKLITKRKTFTETSSNIICQLDNFDVFCEFCNAIHFLHSFSTSRLAKNIALYQWKDSYYLVFRNINYKHQERSMFLSALSEFGKLLSCSEHFETKLLEHGKVIIKKNAIDVGLKFFA